MGRFDYVMYDDVAKNTQELLKKAFEQIEEIAVSTLDDGRAKSLVLTHLEEAYMWTGKSIRDSQIARGGSAEHIAKRSNE